MSGKEQEGANNEAAASSTFKGLLLSHRVSTQLRRPNHSRVLPVDEARWSSTLASPIELTGLNYAWEGSSNAACGACILEAGQS